MSIGKFRTSKILFSVQYIKTFIYGDVQVLNAKYNEKSDYKQNYNCFKETNDMGFVKFGGRK